jgi:hypothetical protein
MPCRDSYTVTKKKKMETSSLQIAGVCNAASFDNFLDFVQRKRIMYPGPLIMQFDQIVQCAHVKFLRIGHLVNVS